MKIDPVGKTLLVAFSVPGKAVPWKAPTVTRWSTYKNPKLIAWQTVIAMCADKAWSGEPYCGPVEVHFWFIRKASKKIDLLHWFRKRPDVDNVFKAFADTITGQALKGGRANPANPMGRILGDDSHIVSVMIRKQYGEADSLYAAIYSVDEQAPKLPFDLNFRMNDI